MRWFGPAAFSSACEDAERVSVPVGACCDWCGERIVGGDDGYMHGSGEIMVYHADCQVRAVVGGANHQIGKCTCCGGSSPPDPPGLTKREAASMAVLLWEQRRRSKP
jgi:hypothetical protein